MSAAVSAHVSEGFGELPSLRAAWEDLFVARPNEPSTSFEWTQALVAHHVKADDRCFLVQLRRRQTLIGIVPLIRRVMTVMRQRIRLLLPVSEQYNTHSDLLLASPDDDVVAALVHAMSSLEARWDCFRMSRLLEENPLVPALRRALMVTGTLQTQRQGLAAYVLDLPKSYNEYLSNRSAKFRNHLKRITRKLHDAGDVCVRQLAAAGDFQMAFDALLYVEESSWKQSHGTAITAVGHQRAFYRHLTSAAHAAGRLHLHWLVLDGRPVAYNLGYLTAGRYHYLKTSYCHDVRGLSPSTYLRAHLVDWLINKGVRQFDFPGEPYEWEAQWTDTPRRRTVICGYPRTIRGHALAVADRLRKAQALSGGVVHVDPRAQRPSL